MRILLFGTGDYYRKYRDWFRREDILGLVDNDENKRGTLVDGYKVYLPQEAVQLSFDCVVILSVHEEGMRRQLLELGVPDDTIYIFSELYKHPELIMPERAVCLWGGDRLLSGILSGGHAGAVLLMSHNLDLNGAALALFYLARILAKNGFSVFFASWTDGALRQYLYEENIPVVIDPNLQMRTQREVKWTHRFRRIICNTLNYYLFLADRSPENQTIWWLHDPVMFYRSLDQELLHRIKPENLAVYAVSPIAEGAFKTYFPDFEVRQLVYGIPDVPLQKKIHYKMELIVIGNVQEYKGQDILVRALEMLDDEILSRIHVKVVGFRSTAYADGVKRSAEKLGDVISFIPPVDREGVHRLLDESDVLICPSRVDTMSIVTNEGMQHGLPCIVSDAAGVSAYIKNGENGFIVRRGDASALAERIAWCVEHRKDLEQIGKASRMVYEQYFTMEVFEKNVLKVIREVL